MYDKMQLMSLGDSFGRLPCEATPGCPNEGGTLVLTEEEAFQIALNTPDAYAGDDSALFFSKLVQGPAALQAANNQKIGRIFCDACLAKAPVQPVCFEPLSPDEIHLLPAGYPQ